jgi:hypothetical protein
VSAAAAVLLPRRDPTADRNARTVTQVAAGSDYLGVTRVGRLFDHHVGLERPMPVDGETEHRSAQEDAVDAEQAGCPVEGRVFDILDHPWQPGGLQPLAYGIDQ